MIVTVNQKWWDLNDDLKLFKNDDHYALNVVLNGIFHDFTTKSNKSTRNHEFQETGSINFIQSSLYGYMCPPPPPTREVFQQGKVKNGFFIEAGADDFESDSNSVYFEEQETLI